MEIDYIGTNKVATLIKESKYAKFVILKYGSARNTPPIFESTQTSTSVGASEKFEQWAKLTDNSNVYDIVLFNQTAAPPAATKKRATAQPEEAAAKKEIRFTFQLKADAPQQSQSVQANNFQQMLDMALEKQAMVFQTNDLKREMQELREELRAREEEEEEAKPALGGVDVNAIVMGLINGFLKGGAMQPAAAVAGIETDPRLQKAISTLHQHDPEIVSDLEKLAGIAEKTPGTFQLIITQLRNFNA